MNKRMLTISLLFFIAISLCVFTKSVTAGGVIDYTTKVTNTTSYTAHITLMTYNGDTKEATVSGNSVYTFHTGKQCPSCLYGTVQVGSTTTDILNYYCIKSGEKVLSPTDCRFSFSDLYCKSSDHKLTTFDNYTSGIGFSFEKD